MSEQTVMEIARDPQGNIATYDREATLRAYSNLSLGCADRCECKCCAIYRTVRGRDIFPADFLEVADAIGIDVLKDSEVTFYCDPEYPEGSSGFMEGEFLFVGSTAATNRDGAWGFVREDIAKNPDVFGETVASLVFSIPLPWSAID